MSVRRLAVVCLVVPLLLSGCQDAAAPEPKLPPPQAEPPASVPPKKETAEEFIRRWVAEANEAQVTGEVDDYLGMVGECDPCRGFATSVREVYEAGGHAEFEGARVTGVRKVARGHSVFDVTQSIPETRIFRADASEPEVLPAGESRIRVTLERPRGRWVVADMVGLPS